MPNEFTTIVSLCSGLAAIYGIYKIAKAPLDKIETHDKDIKDLKKAVEKKSEIDKAILNGLQAMTNHMIDGNGVAQLKASRTELQKAINEIATK